MPEVAYIVKIELPDTSAVADVAEEISDDLYNAGHDVISVAPWERPSLGLGGSAFKSPFGEPPAAPLA